MASQWFIKKGQNKVGPYTSSQLREIANKGGLTPQDHVLKEGTTEWVKAKRLKNLFPDERFGNSSDESSKSGNSVFYDPSQIESSNRNQSVSDLGTFDGNFKKSLNESLGGLNTYIGKIDESNDHNNETSELVTVSDRYSSEKVLGKGGMGEVILAFDKRLQRYVAIKRIRGDHTKSKSSLRRFMAEAQSIAKVTHPNIVQIFEYGHESTGPFLILEYVDGGSLQDLLKQEIVKPEIAIDLMSQILDGLGKAHTSGIVHRDIKPANILVTKDGIPKLTDFGLAKLDMEFGSNTISGAIIGTIDFMAPEQRKDAALTDERSDLWSVGATFYQMVTGQNPRIIEMDLVPGMIKPIISKSLKSNKSDRYQTAQEFKSELDQLKLLIQSNKTELKLLIQSIKISLKKENHEQLLEDLDRVLEIDPDNLDLAELKKQTLEKIQSKTRQYSEQNKNNKNESDNTVKSLKVAIYISGILVTVVLAAIVMIAWNRPDQVGSKDRNAQNKNYEEKSSDFNKALSENGSEDDIKPKRDNTRVLPKDLILSGNYIKDLVSTIDMKQFQTADVTKERGVLQILQNLKLLCLDTIAHYMVFQTLEERKGYIMFSNPILESMHDLTFKRYQTFPEEDKVENAKDISDVRIIRLSKDLKRVVCRVVFPNGSWNWCFERVGERYKINWHFQTYNNDDSGFRSVSGRFGRIPELPIDVMTDYDPDNPLLFANKANGYIGKKSAFLNLQFRNNSIGSSASFKKIGGVSTEYIKELPIPLVFNAELFGPLLQEFMVKMNSSTRKYCDMNVSGTVQRLDKYLSKKQIIEEYGYIGDTNWLQYVLIVEKLEIRDLSEECQATKYIENPITPDDLKKLTTDQ